MTSILLVGAGASVSTKDVENGYRYALKQLGVDVIEYALDLRIERSASFLNYLWRKAKKAFERPTNADVLYMAGQGVMEKALRYEVDFVLVISGMFLHPDNFVLMKRAGLRTGVIFTESPYDDLFHARVAPHADICWTNERTSVPYLRQVNRNTYYLAHAYDPERHFPILDEDQESLHDVIFVGTGFPERIELLKAIDWDGIDLGLYGSWSMVGSRSKLQRYIKGGAMPNDETVQLYRRSKIGLNLHRVSMGYSRTAPRIAHAESLNPRAYELAACGVFQISDYRVEIDEVFDTVPVFHDPKNLSRMIRLYLQDSDKRRRSAYAALEAVRGNTFEARAQQVLADIEEVFSPRLVAVNS